MAQLADTSLASDGNLVAYYKLEDETDEQESFDLTNNGTTEFNAAKFNNGMDTGTTNSTKSLSIVNDLGITGGAMSFTCWVKMNTEIGAGNDTFMYQGDAGTDTAYFMRYEYNGGTRRIRYERQRQGVADDVDYHEVTLGTTEFNHVVLTYDATTVKGYFNNIEVASVDSTGSGTSGITDFFALGESLGGFNLGDFIIDDAAVFTKKLSTTEIAELFNPPVSGAPWEMMMVGVGR